MSKSRIYVKDLKSRAYDFLLSKENTKIVKTVLRLKKGEEVDIVDGVGTLAVAEIAKYAKDGCHVKVKRKSTVSINIQNTITLLQSFPKGDRPETVIQKLVELGADRIIFFTSKRSVAQIKRNKINSKKARFEKIAIEAMRQCKRLYNVEINFCKNLKECLEAVKTCDLKLVFHEEDSGTPIKSHLSQTAAPKEICFAVGPEGGFAKEEISEFVDAGFKQVKLGEEVLRTDTAPLAIMSILNYQYRW